MGRKRGRGGASRTSGAETAKHDQALSQAGLGFTAKQLLAKARVATDVSVDEPTAIQDIQATQNQWGEQGAILAPYDPETLLRLNELTPHLQPNIDAYAQNIDGYGYHSAPKTRWMEDLSTEEAESAVRYALEYERWLDEEEAAFGEQSEKADDEPPNDAPEEEEEITEDDIQAKIEMVQKQLRREQFRFDSWFENCCSTMSFTRLRRIVRMDKEASGWGCMEMIRDEHGRLMRLGYIPGFTVRPLIEETELVQVVEQNPATPLSDGREVRVWRRFRRYVQIVGSRKVYYRSPGDPRIVSMKTGKIYETIQKMQHPDAEGKNAQQANELLWFAHHYPLSPCSPPRWISNLLRVLGTREADETNYYHLKNKTMSGGILFVYGGTVKQGVKDRLESRISQELQGSENTSRIMVVEAMPVKAGPNDRTTIPQMQFQSMRDTNQTDAMFLDYDTRAADSIGAAFRQSPLMRGYTPDNLNRATAETVVELTEQQVYSTEREDFDWQINKHVIPEIGINLLDFKSNTPPTTSAEEIGEFVKAVAPHGGVTPAQIQRLSADVLNLPYEQIKEDWAQQPMALTLAGFMPDSGGVPLDAEEQTRLRNIEDKIARITTDELRDNGIDVEAKATLFDLHTEERDK